MMREVRQLPIGERPPVAVEYTLIPEGATGPGLFAWRAISFADARAWAARTIGAYPALGSVSIKMRVVRDG